ncbi:MAG: hypothetical protein RR335_09420 [Eubacterium sp.]
MKKQFKAMVAMILVITVTFAIVPQASAASEKQYISDMKISYDGEGRQKLVDAGYTVVKQDLNEDANKGTLKSNRQVYMGYKTTKNPKDAITDVAMMSEECGYSFSDYQEILKKQYSKYEILAVKEMNVIKEFRQNYKNNSPFAKSAYETLNNFKEDDSGKLVGDFFLDENLSMDNLFKFITQITQFTLNSINNILVSGISEYTEDNFFTRVSAISNAEMENIKKDNAFYDDGMLFYDQALTLKNDIKKAESKIAELEGKEEIDAEKEYVPFVIQFAFIIDRMKTVKYGDKNLYDVFMQDNLTIQDLYPLVKVMTRGQIDAVALAGFSQLFQTTNVATVDEVNNAQKSAAEELEKPEVISAYFGVDRSMFTDAVAVTSKATREMNSSGDTSPMWGNVSSEVEIALAVTAAVSGYVAIISLVLLPEIAKAFENSSGALRAVLNPKICFQAVRMSKNGALLNANVSLAKAMVGLNITFYVALAVMVIISTVLIVLELYNYYNPTYSKVPKILLDLYDENDQTKFIRYDGVMGLDGEMGDVNGYVGKKWNAIYTTKDPLAGKPIEAKVTTFSDSGKMTDKNYKSVHSFGETAPVNLNNYTFSGSQQIYLYFKQNLGYVDPTQPSKTGSIFTTIVNPLIIGILGIMIGFAGGAIIFSRKRKKIILTQQNTTSE